MEFDIITVLLVIIAIVVGVVVTIIWKKKKKRKLLMQTQQMQQGYMQQQLPRLEEFMSGRQQPIQGESYRPMSNAPINQDYIREHLKMLETKQNQLIKYLDMLLKPDLLNKNIELNTLHKIDQNIADALNKIVTNYGELLEMYRQIIAKQEDVYRKTINTIQPFLRSKMRSSLEKLTRDEQKSKHAAEVKRKGRA